MPPAAVPNAAKYIVDNFPLIDINGQTLGAGVGVASPARQQRSAAPPPASQRAPKTTAQVAPKTAGLGINFVVDASDRLVIGEDSLVPGGPAERKGTIREGDVLISVDAMHLIGQRLAFDDVLDMVRGPDGSDVILEFERLEIRGTVSVRMRREANYSQTYRRQQSPPKTYRSDFPRSSHPAEARHDAKTWTPSPPRQVQRNNAPWASPPDYYHYSRPGGYRSPGNWGWSPSYPSHRMMNAGFGGY